MATSPFDAAVIVVLHRVAVALVLALTACRHGAADSRTLHYVDKDLVSTRAGDSQAYAYYLQCQLALAQQPPDLARADQQISLALGRDPRDAHLWTVYGQIAVQRGDASEARRASERALALRPEYPPAKALASSLGAPSQP